MSVRVLLVDDVADVRRLVRVALRYHGGFDVVGEARAGLQAIELADQLRPFTVFRVFDRESLAPRGAFSGQVTAWTDGVALHAAPTARFPQGALFAVHSDRAVAAFDLGDVARALDLDPACLQ